MLALSWCHVRNVSTSFWYPSIAWCLCGFLKFDPGCCWAAPCRAGAKRPIWPFILARTTWIESETSIARLKSELSIVEISGRSAPLYKKMLGSVSHPLKFSLTFLTMKSRLKANSPWGCQKLMTTQLLVSYFSVPLQPFGFKLVLTILSFCCLLCPIV